MAYYIGLDVGTSGCRAVAFDGELRPLAAASREYTTLSPEPGWAEQDPEEVAAAVAATLINLLAHPALAGERPAAVGLATAMHALLALDEQGRPLMPALTWADLRAAEEAAWLAAAGGADRLYRRTGCPVHPMYLPAKVLWLQRRRPDIWRRAAKLASLKDYLVHRLCGVWLLDHASASATGLLHLSTLDWDPEVLAAVGLTPERLSTLTSPLTILEGFTTPWARQQGLPAGVPLVVGATDGTLSNPGTGVVRPGQMAVMVGTSAAVRVMSEVPLLDPQRRTWCYHLLPGLWVPGGAANNGGNVLQWYRDQFGLGAADAGEGSAAFATLSAWAESVPPGSRGLIFLPFLAGERSPGWNAQARGMLCGLTLRHGPPEVVRALLEGVTYQLYSIYAALAEVVGPPAEVRASGGFVKSPTWLQLAADVFGLPLAVPEATAGSACGAAALAMVAQGALASLADLGALLRVERTVEPDPARHALYRELYALYQDLYGRLTPAMAALADWQQREESTPQPPASLSREAGMP